MYGVCNELRFFWLANLLFLAISRDIWKEEGEPEFSSLGLVTSAGLSMSQQCLYPKLSNHVELYEPMSLKFLTHPTNAIYGAPTVFQLLHCYWALDSQR